MCEKAEPISAPAPRSTTVDTEYGIDTNGDTMDDPNAALPSDPTVDESYTKGSPPRRAPRALVGTPPTPPAAPPERSAPPPPSGPPEGVLPGPRPTARPR